MIDPREMTTGTLEANMRLYGIHVETYSEWSDDDAARVALIITEWSRR